MPTAYIAIGSNHHPHAHIERSLEALAADPDWHLVASSRRYRSPAVDSRGNVLPDATYVNAVVALTTDLTALEVRRRLRSIEARLGRDRSQPHRVTIDLDLIALDAYVLDVDGHHLPDPAIERHAFVAVPFSDIAPEWVHPETGQTIAQMAATLQHQTELEIVSQ